MSYVPFKEISEDSKNNNNKNILIITYYSPGLSWTIGGTATI